MRHFYVGHFLCNHNYLFNNFVLLVGPEGFGTI